MRKIAVIGLGRFGMALACDLGRRGVEVIAIDSNPELVNQVKNQVTVAVQLDATDRDALKSQELGKVDVCVIAIGECFEAALLTTVIAKKLKIPRVICRAQTQFHAEIFREIGADDVIQPEIQAGEHLGRKLANPHLKDFISLAEDYTLLELHAPKAFWGYTLQELRIRSKYAVNLVTIKRPTTAKVNGERVRREDVIIVPTAEDVIQEDDVLVVVGSNEALARLPKE